MLLRHGAFPAELVLQVISHIDEIHDKATLSACSRLGIFFQKDAQRRLFSRVRFRYVITSHLTLHDISTNSQKFLRSLDHSDLAIYVRSFTICLLTQPPAVNSLIEQTHATSLYKILPVLHGLTEFSIEGMSGSFEDTLWHSDNLPPKFMEAIENTLLYRRGVVSLSLLGPIIFPKALLWYPQKLKNLTISTKSFQDQPDAPIEEIERNSLVYLTSLNVHSTAREPESFITDFVRFFKALRTPICLSQLTHLDISRCKTTLPANLQQLLSVCPRHLESLVLPIPSAAFDSFRPPAGALDLWTTEDRIVDLHTLTSLSSLVFAGHIISRGQAMYSSLWWLGEVIKTLNSTNTKLRVHANFFLTHIPVSYEPLPWELFVEPLLSKVTNVHNIRIEVLSYARALDAYLDDKRLRWMHENLRDSPILQKLGTSFVEGWMK